MNMYYGYHFLGMHLVWWLIWVVFIVWIFATPYDIPGQKTKKDTPLDILKKRYADGTINTEEYMERKRNLENS